jgi:S-adenosylmethionine:tRNA ribosyltransferase-isomerase
MRVDEFDYDLPVRLIAQTPLADRDTSRLLVVNRKDGSLTHHRFRDLPELLASGDLLILNDTRVVPARLLGRKARTGGAWEGLFLGVTAEGYWELLCRTRGALRAGDWIEIEPGPLRLELVGKTPERHWLAKPVAASESALALLERHGRVPLPPYIRKGRAEPADRERYQTVYARVPGSAAAPTAGLHFTPEVLAACRQRGIDQAWLTLHVGAGTFQPVQVEEVEHHQMHREWGDLPSATVEAITACRRRGGRVVAVGTTSARVLETVAATGSLAPWSGSTSLFIRPPYTFRAVDALITNFHLPRSTLLMLVSAFAGIDLIRRAYRMAVESEYRFFSYGDAMLIL